MTYTRNLIIPSLPIVPGPVITTASLPNAVQNSLYSFSMVAINGQQPYSWAILSDAPNTGNWLTISPTGTLSGTPPMAETEAITIQVLDFRGQRSSQAFSLTVQSSLPVITTANLPGAIVGQAYSFTMSATSGVPPYTWAITSDTPNSGNWLSISAAGVLSGTPTTSETETVTIKVTDSLSNPGAPATFSLSVAAANTSGFPQLGATLVGGNIDFVNLPHMGNMGVAFFTNYPGYNVGGKTFAQQVTAVLALNPSMKILPQTNVMEITRGDAAHLTEYNSDATNSWFLFANYNTRGTWNGSAWTGNVPVLSQASKDSVNLTSTNLTSATDAYAPANSTYATWQAGWTDSFCRALAVNIAGVHTDNWFYQPRVNGDYLQSGNSQTPSTVAQTWRNAYASWASALKAKMGANYMVTGNVADWGTAGASITGYSGILHGGLFEGAFGTNFGGSENGGWLTFMASYKLMLQNMAQFQGAGPYLVIMTQAPATNYQGVRYCLCSTLLDNGYCNWAISGAYNAIGWLDEFGQNLGPPIAGPGNPSNGTYSSGGIAAAWQNGVWRRDFQNGISLVNPRGNGAQTVNLETNYYHFLGTQANPPNNGQVVTSVTLADPNVSGTGGDGLLLMRTLPPLLTYQAPTDQTVRVEPAVPAMGAANGTPIIDDISGFRILRVTDATFPGGPLGTSSFINTTGSCESCQFSAFNNRFWVTGWNNWTYLFNLNKVSFQVTSITPGGGSPQINLFDPQWHPTNESILFGNTTLNANTVFYQFNCDTNVYTIYYDFTSAASAVGESHLGDMCVADNLNMAGRFGTQDNGKAAWFLDSSLNLHVLNIHTATIDGVVVPGLTALPSTGIHNVRMGQEGRYVKITTSGHGITFWDTTAGTAWNTTDTSMPAGSSHQAVAFGQYLNKDFVSPLTDIYPPYGLKRGCATAAQGQTPVNLVNTPALNCAAHQWGDLYWSWCNQKATGPSVPALSTICGFGTGPGNFSPVTESYTRELTMTATDGSGTVWRLCHHFEYANPNNSGQFQYGVHATVSRDGRYVLFCSSWAGTLGTGGEGLPRLSVFLLECK